MYRHDVLGSVSVNFFFFYNKKYLREAIYEGRFSLALVSEVSTARYLTSDEGGRCGWGSRDRRIAIWGASKQSGEEHIHP